VGVGVGRAGEVATKKIKLGLGASLLALLAVLLARAATFTLEQPPVAPIAPIPLDEAAATERFAAALRIETVTKAEPPNFDPNQFARLREHLAKSFPLAHTKLSTETVSGHSLLFTWKGSDSAKKPILLMAHQDVVPIDDATKWSHPPFSGEVADGFIWGRGALDVKSGMLGILEAVEKLASEGFQPERTIYLAFGHDEEIGGHEGAAKIAALLTERKVRLEMVLDEGMVITDGIIPDVSVPVALIGIAEKGYVSVELSAESLGGHSSMPPERSAIGMVSEAVAKLETNPFPARLNQRVAFFDYVGPKMPFTKRIIFANLWLFQPVVTEILSAKPATAAGIRTTTAPTIFQAGVKENVLPRRASAVINFRIVPGETPETVIARVKELVGDSIDVHQYGEFSAPPSPISRIGSDSYQRLAETIRAVYPDPELVVAPGLVVGATDSRYFAPIADDVYRFLFNRMGPADLPRFHGTDERIAVDNYLTAIRFYYQLIKRLQ
jgi:carboxypeptidase PM20D1